MFCGFLIGFGDLIPYFPYKKKKEGSEEAEL
jgi:hypothetical protein